MAAGRPSEYTEEIADAICARIAEGESVRAICKSDESPAMSTIFKWLRDNPSFSEQYARAKEIQAEAFSDELLDIADDGVNDFVEIQKKNGAVVLCDQENIQRSKLRVDTRKWLMSKFAPKKYGDKLAIDGNLAVGVQLVNDIPRPDRG